MELPNNWHCRPYQDALWKALAHQRIKRAVAAWHRRSGKDDIALNWTATAAFERVGTYWHLLPQANQARKAVWDAVNPASGAARIDQAFPRELRQTTRQQDMLIRFVNGSTWQVVGSDNYNSLVGSPPVGVVFSEYALADPNAWAFIRPILAENGGWAMFISTPRGRNHFHKLYELARSDPNWFGQRLTVADTGIITDAQIEQERRELAAERGEDEANDIINQEYYCDFDAAIPGAYYGREISKLEKAGRICDLPHDPRFPVVTGWDLGVGDPTGIWFAQQIRGTVNIIDYYEHSGAGADHYARVLKEREYTYDYHILPHDAEHREWGTIGASTRVNVLKGLKVRPIRVLPQSSREDGINAVRVLLPRCRFANTPDVSRGLNALRQYQKKWDEKLRVYSNTPLHDWTSHAADAFRYLSLGLKPDRTDAPPRKRYAET